ncbi:MAG TPA: hypothetical protein DDY39_03870 [Nitrospira sp.]|nr:hypothetical protein [Nitrospira sp.]HBR51436.1 hypothetical protein [Nitrospira sp.]
MSISFTIHLPRRSMSNRIVPSLLCLLSVVLIVLASPAIAGWIAIEKQHQPAGIETIYVDPEQIQRTDTRATLWQLTDLKWNNTTRFLSLKTHKEFDCANSRVRTLQVIEFSRQMGTGRSRSGYIENGNWQAIGTHGVDHALSKTACGKS